MSKQLLHLVFGGELTSLDGNEFRDLANVHMVGVYPNFAKAKEAWKAMAQATVDNAHTRYFVVHLHRLLDPETDTTAAKAKPAPARKTGAAKTQGARRGGKRRKTSNRK